MQTSRRILLPAALVLLVPAAASAQVCRGGLDFVSSQLQGQAGLEFESGSAVYAAGGGYGGSRYYGMGTLGVRTYDQVDGNTVILQGVGGRTFTFRRTGAAVHCLEVEGTFGTGPDNVDAAGTDLSSSSVGFSWSTAVRINPSAKVRVTPYLGVAAVYSSVVRTLPGGTSSTASNDFYELITVGMGLAFSDELALRPYVRFPLARDNEDPVYGVKLSMTIQRR